MNLMTQNNHLIKDIVYNAEGLIFDMDGTLLDSMGMWDNIDQIYLKQLNLDVPNNLKAEIEHLSFHKTAKYFKERFNISDSVSKIEHDWYTMALSIYKNKKMIKPYVKEFLSIVKSRKIKICLATSNYMETARTALKTNKIYNFFDSISVTDEVEHDKDFPDVFILSSKKLGIPPENCVVFEDSLPAIMSAKSANMKVIAVKDSHSIHSLKSMLKHCDAGISSFKELI